MNGRDLTIVGVAPPGFHGFVLSPESDLWAPLSLLPSLWPSVVEFFERRDQPGPVVLGRLRPDIGLQAADGALESYARSLEEAHPDTNNGTTLRAVAFTETRLSDRTAVVSYLGIVAGVAAMVFLLACVNVAGLKFSDLSARQGEVAIRKALGASSARMARQFLVENLVLYVPSFAASLWVADAGIHILRRLSLFRISLAEVELRLDWRVVLAGLLVTFAGAILGSVILVFDSRRFELGGSSGRVAERSAARQWAHRGPGRALVDPSRRRRAARPNVAEGLRRRPRLPYGERALRVRRSPVAGVSLRRDSGPRFLSRGARSRP